MPPLSATFLKPSLGCSAVALASACLGCAVDARSVDTLPDLGAQPGNDAGGRTPNAAPGSGAPNDAGRLPVERPGPDEGGEPGLSPNTLAALDPERTGFILAGGGGDVSGGGDFNGDGRVDLVVTNGYATRAYVVFGTATPRHRDLAQFPDPLAGVLIESDGTSSKEASAWSLAFDGGVRFIGDVNGDGLDDVAVNAGRSVTEGLGNDTAVCVVFADRAGGRITIESIVAGNGRGFAIRSPLILAMDAAGDVNGDGRADLILGEPSRGEGGSAYVVYGKSDPSPITLDSIDSGGGGGYVYDGPVPGDQFGVHVAGLGDMNADGVPDFAVRATNQGNAGSKVYVVWGERQSGDRVAVGERGFSVNLGGNGNSGALAAGHDVNGDGINDVLVSRWSFNDPRSVSYVIFGRTAPGVVEGEALEAGSGGGFAIFGAPVSFSRPTPGHMSLAAIGDISGDGREDFLVGDALATQSAVYAIFGRSAVSTLRGPELTPDQGFVIPGYQAEDETGRGVAGVGDVNGDGLADYAVTTPNLLSGVQYEPPREAAHVVYGRTRFDAATP